MLGSDNAHVLDLCAEDACPVTDEIELRRGRTAASASMLLDARPAAGVVEYRIRQLCRDLELALAGSVNGKSRRSPFRRRRASLAWPASTAPATHSRARSPMIAGQRQVLRGGLAVGARQLHRQIGAARTLVAPDVAAVGGAGQVFIGETEVGRRTADAGTLPGPPPPCAPSALRRSAHPARCAAPGTPSAGRFRSCARRRSPRPCVSLASHAAR